MNEHFEAQFCESSHSNGANIRFLNANEPSHFVKHTDSNIELICVLSGSPSVVIGSHVEKCRAGDIFLIGKNLLHAIQSDQENKAEIAIFHLQEKFFEDTIAILRDFQQVGDLFGQLSRGLLWRQQSSAFISSLLSLRTTTGIAAVVTIIEVLSGLAGQKDYRILNQVGALVQDRTEEKIKKVFDYTQTHYREAITLQQIAAQVNFTETSFCRYFKKLTGKNYYNYLNEVRIDNACIILMENRFKSVEEVCYNVGYSSPSTFYKHFKKLVNMTPTEFQDKAMTGRPGIRAA